MYVYVMFWNYLYDYYIAFMALNHNGGNFMHLPRKGQLHPMCFGN